MPAPSLELAEGIELGCALTARVADDIGARALAIKGLVNEAHGLREPRPSADVDLLVEPGRHADVVDALLAAGWRRAPTPPAPPAFGYHSVTLNHPSWPCEIDVHDRFPGFLADPADAFETFWVGRTFIVAAGVAVPAPGLCESALLMALHALRAPTDPRNSRELIDLVTRLSARPVDLDRLRSLAAETGCLATARPLLVALGIDVPPADRNDPRLVEWELRRTAARTRNVGWLVALRRASPVHWPALLWSILLSNEPMLRLRYPQAPPGRAGVWLARWWRTRTAVRDLPRAMRLARRIR